MSSITKPFGATVILVILILAFNFTNFATALNYAGLTLLLLVSTLFIHEIGHVLFGVFSGYRFNYLTIGPVTIENSDRLRIKRNESWFLFGGVASCSPQTSNLSTIAKQHQRFVAGGPILSLAAAVISLIIGMLMNVVFITYFGFFNIFIFLVTILPYRGALKSDGRVLLELKKGGKQTEEFLISLLLVKEMSSPTHPKDWSEHFVEQAKTLKPTADNIMVGYVLFYYTLVRDGYEKASAILEPFKQIPVTKQNKYALQFIIHIRQIDMVLNENYDEANILKLHELLNSMELINFRRSEAVLAKLRGNEEQAKLKISEAMNEIIKNKKLFGFMYAEEELTNLLTNKIMA